MKKTLLASAAIAGLVLASAPAQAQMELTIGGHSKNYIGFSDQDNVAGSTLDSREFDMQRETELHFNGESTLDNGLTFGFQVETEVDSGDDANTIEESYIYLSGTWGRVNLGSEDGAAYLLQVAAPSADANIDGIRQYVQPVNYPVAFAAGAVATPIAALGGQAFGTPADASQIDGFDYDQDITGKSEKITYLSPNFNGFQLGASYTHDLGDAGSADPIAAGFNQDDVAGSYGSAYEVAVRYEGVMSNFGYAIGAGYTHINTEEDGAAGSGLADDDLVEYNVGLDIDVGAFGIGAIYKNTEQSVATANTGDEADTYVIGVDYTTGPFKFGASYFNQDDETTGVANTELETDRYTGGVIYTAGPGLSFRGSISYIDHELGAADVEATSVMGGVQINF